MPDQVELLSESLQRIINRGSIDVPMLPEVTNKALSLAQDASSNASEMADLIQSDQSLAGHVMRIANSVAYTPLSNLVSLQQAISRLGMRVIGEIALAASIGAKLFNTPGYEKHVTDIWHHALATSLWSKEIARHCRSNVEVAFLAGLLHSIGRPAVLQAILDLAKEENTILTQAEVQTLENRYCHQVSLAVINAWQMPPLVIDVVSAYTEQNGTLMAGNRAAEVIVGARFATHMITPEKLDKVSLLALPALTALNLYQDEAEELLGQMDTIKARLAGLGS